MKESDETIQDLKNQLSEAQSKLDEIGKRERSLKKSNLLLQEENRALKKQIEERDRGIEELLTNKQLEMFDEIDSEKQEIESQDIELQSIVSWKTPVKTDQPLEVIEDNLLSSLQKNKIQDRRMTRRDIQTAYLSESHSLRQPQESML